jgi:hypothetical protein
MTKCITCGNGFDRDAGPMIAVCTPCLDENAKRRRLTFNVGLITAEDRDGLDRLGLFFGFTSVKHARAQAKKPPPIASTPTLKSNVPQPNIDRIYWIEVVRRLRPDLSDDDLNQAYDVQRALVTRAALRDSKPSRGKVKEIPTRPYFADAPKIRLKTKA